MVFPLFLIITFGRLKSGLVIMAIGFVAKYEFLQKAGEGVERIPFLARCFADFSVHFNP